MHNEWMGGPNDHETPDDDDHEQEEQDHGAADEGQGGLEHGNDKKTND